MTLTHSVLYLLAALAVFGAITSSVFNGMTLVGARRFLRNARLQKLPDFHPPVSVLKPVHGDEPDLEASLTTFYQQNYPSYEVLFCARHESDAGLAVARRVAARFPHIPTKIVTCGEPLWPNARTFSLETLRQNAANEILVTSDSDVSVTPDYLAEVVAPFADPKIGMLTCIYRGVTRHGLWARLEALGMSVEMSSGVLVADMLEGMQFTLGPTMVMRKSSVEAIGGYEKAAQYLADDFVLGNWAAREGIGVALSRYVISHHILNPTFRSSIRHQLGWARSTRFSRPSGHFGSVLTFAVPFGLLGLLAFGLLGHLWIGLGLLAFTVLCRALLSAYISAAIVKDPACVRASWLYPLRDFLGFLFWIASYTSDRVHFRGIFYKLVEDGRIVPME